MEKTKEKESDSKYIDPSNKEQVMNDIKNSEMHSDVIRIIDKTFPGWLLGWPKKYCIDYPRFQANWEFVCKRSNSSPLSVIIVDKIVFNDPKYSLVKFFCELLTVFGHSVRRKEEFIECKVCGDAIPTPMIYNQLKERKIDVPLHYSLRCSKC